MSLFNPNITLEKVQELIKAGADVNVRNDNGYTPLHYQNVESIKELIKSGSDVNVRNIIDDTPLQSNIFCKQVYDDICSERITKFIRNCKWYKLLKLTKTQKFYKWYCGEDDGNGGGVGRRVDCQRIMSMKLVK